MSMCSIYAADSLKGFWVSECDEEIGFWKTRTSPFKSLGRSQINVTALWFLSLVLSRLQRMANFVRTFLTCGKPQAASTVHRMHHYSSSAMPATAVSGCFGLQLVDLLGEHPASARFDACAVRCSCRCQRSGPAGVLGASEHGWTWLESIAPSRAVCSRGSTGCRTGAARHRIRKCH